MANTQEICNSFKTELLLGLHALGTCSETRTISNKDNLNVALYHTSATINKSTTIYTVTGEIVATGYTAGGIPDFANTTEPALDTDTAHWTPNASFLWSTMTEIVAFNCCLIYNDQFATKRAISVHTFGDQTVTAGDFTLTMPTNDATTGLIRLL